MTTVFFATSRARVDGPGGRDVFGHKAASDPAHRLWLGTAEVGAGGGPAKARKVRAVDCKGRDNFDPADGPTKA